MELSTLNLYNVIKDFNLKLRESGNPTSVDETGNFIYLEKLSNTCIGLYKIIANVNQIDYIDPSNSYIISIYNSADGIIDNTELTTFNLSSGKNFNFLINISGYPYIKYYLYLTGVSPSIDFEMFVSDII